MRFGLTGVDDLVDEQQRIRDGLRDLVAGALEQLPAILTALVVVAVFALLASAARLATRRVLLWRTGRPSFAEVLSRIVRAAVVVLGLLAGLVIAAPSVDVAQVVGGLGVSSIAIGFAFKDILQNSLAGLLLLFREPFRAGDEIQVDDWHGTVEAITIRETRLRTFDRACSWPTPTSTPAPSPSRPPTRTGGRRSRSASTSRATWSGRRRS